MTASYGSVFSRFLGKIKDWSFLALPENTAAEQMCEWLHSAVSKPFVRKLFDSFSMDDEIQMLTFTMYDSIDNGYDLDFSIEILAQGMILEWLTPWVNNTETIAQAFWEQNGRFYSQAEHLARLQELFADVRREQRRLIRDHSYVSEIIRYREGQPCRLFQP